MTKRQAFGDFADYVEKQQATWRAVASSKAASSTDSGYATTSEEHAELDVLDALDLEDSAPRVTLKDLLIRDEYAADLEQLRAILRSRLQEGHGETLFDLGQEDNGDPMDFTKEQWNRALERLRSVASGLLADCRVLLTRNVGGEVEVGPFNDKDVGATGKIMIRQHPQRPEDVIETRIAVVGNGAMFPRVSR